MTLIIASISPAYATLVSDMRVSSPVSIDDLSGKAGVLTCEDGLALYAYTGLANLNHFRAKTWIADAFLETRAGTLNEAAFRFADVAEAKFANLAYRGKDFTLVVAGFPIGGQAFIGSISNIEDDFGAPLEKPTKQFSTRILQARGDATVAMISGINRDRYMQELRWTSEPLNNSLASSVVIDRSCATIRRLSDDKRTQGTVGKNLLCASIIPMALTGELRTSGQFRPEAGEDVAYTLDQIDLTAGVAVRDIEIKIEDARFIEPQSRNSRCACGSGLKFKRCHGR